MTYSWATYLRPIDFESNLTLNFINFLKSDRPRNLKPLSLIIVRLTADNDTCLIRIGWTAFNIKSAIFIAWAPSQIGTFTKAQITSSQGYWYGSCLVSKQCFACRFISYISNREKLYDFRSRPVLVQLRRITQGVPTH